MPNFDHPTIPLIKSQFANRKLIATEFRGQTTVVVEKKDLHAIMKFLRDDDKCQYDLLSDVIGVDYLNYPKSTGPQGRFAVVYNLLSTSLNNRIFIKVLLDPTVDTRGIEEDPGLHVDTVTDLWPGAEWTEREVFDMLGIRFDGHPDLRRILLWENYPAYPLRKDYPVKGRGEREAYEVTQRDSA